LKTEDLAAELEIRDNEPDRVLKSEL